MTMEQEFPEVRSHRNYNQCPNEHAMTQTQAKNHETNTNMMLQWKGMTL